MKVTMVYDTEEKTLSVDLGGSVLENVESVSFYRHYDNTGKFCMSVNEATIKKEGMIKYSTITALDISKELSVKPVLVTEDKRYAIFNIDPEAVKKGAFELLGRKPQ